jgi:hypothetical protein
MGGLIADIYIEYLFRMILHGIRLIRSRNWPSVNGKILSSQCPKAGYGCDVATVTYEYLVDGAKFYGSFDKPFVLHSSGEDYADSLKKTMPIRLRVKPDDPSISIPAA